MMTWVITYNEFILATLGVNWGHAVAQLVEALRYKAEVRGFDSRWIFSST
jgi:hypothetical protein